MRSTPIARGKRRRLNATCTTLGRPPVGVRFGGSGRRAGFSNRIEPCGVGAGPKRRPKGNPSQRVAIWAGRKVEVVFAPLSNGAACTNSSSSGLHGAYSTSRGRLFSFEVCFEEPEQLVHDLP